MAGGRYALPQLSIVQGCGWDHVCVLTDSNEVKCFSSNANGQLGYGDTVDRPADGSLPYVSLPGPVQHISAGNGHTCATLQDGTGVCWGLNDVNQLGDNIGATAADPVAQPIIMAGDPIAKIEALDGNSCILTTTGQVSCFGKPEGLGICGTANKLSPGDAVVFPTAMSAISDVGRSRNGLCALDGSNLIQCFGDNSYGQLGIGSLSNVGDGTGACITVASQTPLDFSGQANSNDFVPDGLSSSLGTTNCAFASSGNGACWGWNLNGQLGIESNEEVYGDESGEMASLPYVILPAGNIEQLVGGNTHSCMRTDGQEIYCWGNAAYLFGYGSDVGIAPSSMTSLSAVNFGGPSAIDVCVGPTYTCALIDDGTPRCWGTAPNIGAGNTPLTVMTLGNIPTSAPTDLGGGSSPAPTQSPSFPFGSIPPLQGVKLEDEREVGTEQIYVAAVMSSVVLIGVVGGVVTTTFASTSSAGQLAREAAQGASRIDAADFLDVGKEAARERKGRQWAGMCAVVAALLTVFARVVIFVASAFASYVFATLVQSVNRELDLLRASELSLAQVELDGSQTASQISSALGMSVLSAGVDASQFLDLCALESRSCATSEADLGAANYFYVQASANLGPPLYIMAGALAVEVLVTLAETVLWLRGEARKRCGDGTVDRSAGDLPIPVLGVSIAVTLVLVVTAFALNETSGAFSYSAVAWLDNGAEVLPYSVAIEADASTHSVAFACPASAVDPCELDGAWLEATDDRVAAYGFLTNAIIALVLCAKDAFSIVRRTCLAAKAARETEDDATAVATAL